MTASGARKNQFDCIVCTDSTDSSDGIYYLNVCSILVALLAVLANVHREYTDGTSVLLAKFRFLCIGSTDGMPLNVRSILVALLAVLAKVHFDCTDSTEHTVRWNECSASKIQVCLR